MLKNKTKHGRLALLDRLVPFAQRWGRGDGRERAEVSALIKGSSVNEQLTLEGSSGSL